MKKLLAIILALICVFSSFALSATALSEGILGDIIEDQLGITQEKDEADALTCGIYYSSGDNLNVSVIYEPTHTLVPQPPKDVVLTADTPIAVDHNWVCWKEQETGKLYYPGDTIHVVEKVTLVAVWEEKTDNYPSFIRSAIAGLQALLRIIEKFFGAFDAINSTETTTATTEAVTA